MAMLHGSGGWNTGILTTASGKVGKAFWAPVERNCARCLPFPCTVCVIDEWLIDLNCYVPSTRPIGLLQEVPPKIWK